MRSATVLLLALWMYSGFAQEASLNLTHTILSPGRSKPATCGHFKTGQSEVGDS